MPLFRPNDVRITRIQWQRLRRPVGVAMTLVDA
jgi:hypothetical protein